MTKATLAGLIAFINAQPADRPVDHNTWSSCAVGDYARSIDEDVVDSDVHGFASLSKDPVLLALWREAGTDDPWIASRYPDVKVRARSLMDCLSNIPRKQARTYGSLRIRCKAYI